jgi:dolichol-phosphate mannosyltransferase
MDADLSHDPAVVSTMLIEAKSYDLVLGSRYIPGGGIGNWGLWRRFLSIGGNLYTRLVTMSRVHDLTGGFNCYSAALLRRYDLDAVRAEGYGYQMEMKIIAEHLGASIKEIPILFSERTDGQSKISNRIIYEGLIVPWRFSPLFFVTSYPRKP